jgi:predicted double-glycine peptidase
VKYTAISVCVLLFCFNSPKALLAEPPSHYFKLKSLRQMQLERIDKQTRDYSCGAASLAILLSHYFKDTYLEIELLDDILARLPEEELKIRIEEGFSILDLKMLLNRLGYEAEGVKLPLESVALLEGPIIILLKKDKLNHFVVLKGAKQGKAFIADPIAGNYRMPLFELGKQWDGESLVVSRNGFGLPKDHDLHIPRIEGFFPEKNAVRALLYTPPKRPSHPHL